MIPHEGDLNGSFNHFVDALYDQSKPLPWSLRYEERRVISQESRVMRQVELESSWNSRPVEMLWRQLRTFALPSKDFKITDRDFLDFLTISGISPLIRQRIFNMIREQSGGVLDALVFCKAIDTALEDPSIGDEVLLHCFRSLPLPADKEEEVLVEEDVIRVLSRLEKGKGKLSFRRRRKKKLSSKEFLSTVRRQQLNAVKVLFTEELKELNFSTFKHIFLTDGGKLASVFIKQVIEACAKYFIEPFGRFPVIPLRWTNTITPLPFGDIPADADSLLLQDVEYTGVDPNVRKSRRRKKKKQLV